MPGVPDKKLQQIAVRAETPPATMPQPRQPQNLQGLLRFAMEAQEATSNTSQSRQPLDAARREFLQEALQSMSVDVIAVLKTNIANLQQVEDLSTDQIETKIHSFEAIADYIDDIDVANDFEKIDGFAIFAPCLRCEHAPIRAHACDLIAELAQNNPYIQEALCARTAVVPTLIGLLRADADAQVKVKSLYALSCIARDSRVGYASFRAHGGLEACRSALQGGNDKLRTKAAFLLAALRSVDAHLVRDMLRMDFLAVIVGGLDGECENSHEHLLRLVQLLLEGLEGGALDGELKRKLADRLRRITRFVGAMPEHVESQECCERLRQLLDE